MAVQVFTSSVGFGRKGTIIWDSPEMIGMQILPAPARSRYPSSRYSPSTWTTAAPPCSTSSSGNALQAMSYSAVFAVANITSTDKWQGTLETLMVTPANRMALFVGRAVFQSGLSSLIVLGGLFYASVLLRGELRQRGHPGCAPGDPGDERDNDVLRPHDKQRGALHEDRA